MFDFVSKRKWYYLISALVIVPGIISLIVQGLNIGIEFKSGTSMTVLFKDPVSQESLRSAFADLNHPEVVIQHSGKDVFLLQGKVITAAEQDKLVSDVESDPKLGAARVADFRTAEGLVALIFTNPPLESDLRQKLDGLGYQDVNIQRQVLDSFLIGTGDLTKDAFLIQGDALTPDQRDSLISSLRQDFGSLRTVDLGFGTGGSLALIFETTVSENDLRDKITALGYAGTSVKGATEDKVIQQSLGQKFGSVVVTEFSAVSALVAGERVLNTMYAVIAASVGMILYIAWAFRKLFRPFSYGVCAVVALLHDTFLVLGIFSLFRLEVNSTFILAVLTVIGYSVNDTIVVYDRIRENRLKHPGARFETVVNQSLTETLARSMNTSLTTLFALVAIFLFGGATIQNFALALIIGIASGAYSSIFNASQLVVSWERGELWRFLRLSWLPFKRSSASPNGDAL